VRCDMHRDSDNIVIEIGSITIAFTFELYEYLKTIGVHLVDLL